MVPMNPGQPLDRPYSVRIRFRKVGQLQYISHLDLIRTMGRVLARAGAPLWYSEGYNPRPKMVFALPLSVGVESKCEFLDVRLNRAVDCAALRQNLCRNMTEEMQVTEVYLPETSFSEIGFARYDLRIVTADGNETLAQELVDTLQLPELPVMKRGKAGDHEVNIRPLICEISGKTEGDAILLSAVLKADSENYLNPEFLIHVLRERCGILRNEPRGEGYSICRTEVYDRDMSPFR